MTRVYFFTRTGDSEKLAASVAAQTGGTCFRISDHRNWGGAAGFVRGGYYASAKKSLPADYEQPEEGEQDGYVVRNDSGVREGDEISMY